MEEFVACENCPDKYVIIVQLQSYRYASMISFDVLGIWLHHIKCYMMIMYFLLINKAIITKFLLYRFVSTITHQQTSIKLF